MKVFGGINNLAVILSRHDLRYLLDNLNDQRDRLGYTRMSIVTNDRQRTVTVSASEDASPFRAPTLRDPSIGHDMVRPVHDNDDPAVCAACRYWRRAAARVNPILGFVTTSDLRWTPLPKPLYQRRGLPGCVTDMRSGKDRRHPHYAGRRIDAANAMMISLVPAIDRRGRQPGYIGRRVYLDRRMPV